MKKLLFGLIALMLFALSAQAQDAKKDMKNASRALSAFNLDQTGGKDKLSEAKEAIDAALNTQEGQAMADAWITKGDVYNAVATQIYTVRQVGFGTLEGLPQIDNPALEAAQAYLKGLEMSEKKDKGALKGLRSTQDNMINLGSLYFGDEDFGKAYECFNGVFAAHKMLKDNGEESIVDLEEEYNKFYFYAGLAALRANMIEEAGKCFEELYNKNYDEPGIYEALYRLKANSDKEDAYKFLEAGRKKYPDDVSLLFTEINYLLSSDQFEKVIALIQQAIEREPNNISLYTTTGGVFDELHQEASKAGNKEKSKEYFNLALEYYKKALNIDPNDITANYSIGQLYYNEAVLIAGEMNKLADDYSKEATQKYEKLKVEMLAEFDKGLPYFQKSEALDPNDPNTLIALREIYARKDQLDISDEFKRRLEVVQSGGKNESAYFQK